MSEFEQELAERLAVIREQGLYRELRRVNSPQLAHTQVDSRTLLNFSSNDYLGLSRHPNVIAAMVEALREYGAGAGASGSGGRIIRPDRQAERAGEPCKG